MSTRWDETWHRLCEWTNGQAASERLAAQILFSEGFSSLDPSHPLGGPDGAKDALCEKNGAKWVMAAYFPKGRQPDAAIKKKLKADLAGVAANAANGLVFVTNQELALAMRKALVKAAGRVPVDLYHLERVTAIDDVVTRGAQLFGAAWKIWSMRPDVEVRAFAVIRTVSAPEDFSAIAERPHSSLAGEPRKGRGPLAPESWS